MQEARFFLCIARSIEECKTGNNANCDHWGCMGARVHGCMGWLLIAIAVGYSVVDRGFCIYLTGFNRRCENPSTFILLLYLHEHGLCTYQLRCISLATQPDKTH